MGLNDLPKEYGKCVYANKFTLGGYVSLAAWGACALIETQIQTPVTQVVRELGYWGSLMGLGFTMAGLQTFAFYKRTQKTIKNRKAAGKEVKRQYLFLSSQFYCTKKGVELALKEEGLEHLLEKEDKE